MAALDPKTLVKGVKYRLTPKPGERSVSGAIYEGVYLGSIYFPDTPPNFPHVDIKLDSGHALVFPSKAYNIAKVSIATTDQDRLNKKIVMGELLGSPGGKDYEEAKARWTKTGGRRRNKKRKTRRRK